MALFIRCNARLHTCFLFHRKPSFKQNITFNGKIRKGRIAYETSLQRDQKLVQITNVLDGWNTDLNAYIFTYTYTYVRSLSGKSPAIVNIMKTVCLTAMYPGSQTEWTGIHMCEQWWLHCTSRSVGR